ncbi:MAG TPA: DMT family transporter [Jatrophihabitans sp.]
MSNLSVVIPVSLGAALSFAVSTNLKHSSAADLHPTTHLSIRTVGLFVRDMVSHPLWLLGILADGLGLGLQVLALHLGALAVVQPLMVTGLLFSLLLRHTHLRTLNRSEIGWGIALVVSLIGFLLVAGTASAPPAADAADRVPAVVAALVGAGVAVSSVLLARRLKPAVTAAAVLGVAVGVLYAADAALIKASTDKAVQGPVELVTSWQPYAVVAVGAAGLLLCQLAYQAGPLTASQPTIAAVDPLASVVIGVLIFDEQLRRGPWTGAALAGLVILLAWSVLALGRDRAVQESRVGQH